MNSVIDAVNILKSTYQKHLAESISINTKLHHEFCNFSVKFARNTKRDAPNKLYPNVN